MRIHVKVTAKDVLEGKKNINTGDKCPIGLAVNRVFKKRGLGDAYVIWGGGIEVNYRYEYFPKALMPMQRMTTQEQRDFVSQIRRFSFTVKG